MAKFFIAAESENLSNAEGTADEVLETKNELNAVEDDIVSETGDIEELHANIDEGSEAIETLGATADNIEESIESGEGISEGQARQAEITVESISVRLGMPRSAIRMPALESFQGHASRLHASRHAHEGIKEGIAKVWAKIKEIAAAILAKIKELWAKLTRSYPRLIKHIESLVARARDRSSYKLDKNNIDNKSLATAFSTKGKADSGTAMVVIEATGSCLVNLEGLGGIVNRVVSQIEAAADGKGKEDELEATGKAVATFFENLKKNFLAESGGITQGKDGAVEIGPLYGHVFISAKQPGGSDDKEKSARIEVNVEKRKDGVASFIQAMDAKEIASFGGHLIEKAKAFEKASTQTRMLAKGLEETRKFADKMGRLADKAMSDSKDDASTKTRKVLRDAGMSINSILAVVSRLLNSAPTLAFTSISGGASYMSACLSNLKEDKK